MTRADWEVERTLAAMVAERRRGDAFLGEEVGAIGATASRRRWIVDGIDGTHSFIAGRDRWATLVALEVDGEVVVGVASSPARGSAGGPPGAKGRGRRPWTEG